MMLYSEYLQNVHNIRMDPISKRTLDELQRSGKLETYIPRRNRSKMSILFIMYLEYMLENNLTVKGYETNE